MVTSTNCNAFLIHDGPDVMRVDVVEDEREDRGLLGALPQEPGG